MPSIRRCFLCNYKYDPKNAHIMMHSFPSCEAIKIQWMKVCNMLPIDNVTNLFICSKHFQPKDYYKSHSLSTKCKLNIGAIPSKKIINTVGTGFEGSFILPSTSYDEVDVNAEVGGYSETSFDLPSELPTTSFDEVEVQAEHGGTSETSFDLPSELPTTSFDEVEVQAEHGGTSETSFDLPSELPTTSFDDGQSTPKKRRFMEPRYINEISLDHVKTPRRAERVINLVKQTYKNQTIKIKQLQDANRSLHKRVQTLEDMVAHLKQ